MYEDYYNLKSILTDEEEILWQDKPLKKAYVAEAIVKMAPIAILWLSIDTFIISMTKNFVKEVPSIIFILIPFFILHLAPVWIWLASIFKRSISHKNIEYALTTKRIIIKDGLVASNFRSIMYTDVSNVNVKVGLIDKKLGVGDIYLTVMGKQEILYDIVDPYKAYKIIQNIIIDIQTDMNYPNNLRPDDNNGYNTTYYHKH